MNTATAQQPVKTEGVIKNVYLESVLLLERLHRRFLDVIKAELEKMHIADINNVQTLILYNIGAEDLTIGELTHRGYYLGSNVSYNVKKLVENDYIVQERSPHDKRSTRVRLSDKGLKLCKDIDALYQRHIEAMTSHQIDITQLSQVNAQLRHLEDFWTQYMQQIFKL